MSLSDKYDQLYMTDLEVSALVDYPIRTWPLNKMEAIVAVAGAGHSILDIGCGDRSLLYQFRHCHTCLIGLEYSDRYWIDLAGFLSRLATEAETSTA